MVTKSVLAVSRDEVFSMLRKISLNGRQLPVPVPLTDLESVLRWVGEHLLRGCQSITKLRLNNLALLSENQVLEDLSSKALQTKLDANSKLELTVDSPVELAIQTLDTFRHLVFMMEQTLKPMAVECWELPRNQQPSGWQDLRGDLDLGAQLLDHFFDLADYPEIDAEILKEHAKSLERISRALDTDAVKGEWRAFASLLLNKLEVCLGDLGVEADRIQSLLFSHRSELLLREWHFLEARSA